MAPYPRITAIVAVFNRPDDLSRLLSSFSKIEYPGSLRLIVVDDASETDYEKIIAAFRTRNPTVQVQLETLPYNVGPAKARNLALESVDAEYVWFLDSDTEIASKDMLTHAMQIFRERPEVKAVGEEILLLGGKHFTYRAKFFPNFMFLPLFSRLGESPFGDRDAIATANLLVEKKALDEVGAFRPVLNMFEDVDLCHRLRMRGYRLYSCKELAVYHHTSCQGRDADFDFYDNLKKYTKTFHHSRINLVALNRPWLLPTLPIIDFAIGGWILLKSCFRKIKTVSVVSNKSDENIGFLAYAFWHLLGLLHSYRYAYRVFFTRKLNRC